MQVIIHKMNGQRVNLQAYRSWTDSEGVKGIDLTNTEYWNKYGVSEEIIDIPQPEDYSEDTYYRTEQWDAPYVIYTRKPDWMIAEAHNAKIQSQIAALENEAISNGLIRTAIEELLKLVPAGTVPHEKMTANAAARAELRTQFVPVVGKPVPEIAPDGSAQA